VGRDIDEDKEGNEYFFGRAVALSSDGMILASAFQSSTVRIFGFENEAWTQLGSDVGSGDVTAMDVDLLAGPTGGTNRGHAKVYKWI
jgi:hypothetical protein